jgi:hypothetical protein
MGISINSENQRVLVLNEMRNLRALSRNCQKRSTVQHFRQLRMRKQIEFAVTLLDNSTERDGFDSSHLKSKWRVRNTVKCLIH